MGGGLLQLVALGAQDAYLSGNPQITFWKGLFKRHTNFAMEPFRINFSGQPNWGTKQSAIVNRNADLLYSTYLEVHLPHYDPNIRKNACYNNDQFALGYNLLKYVELEIGGQLIDRQYGEWLFLWDTLTGTTENSILGQSLIGAGGQTTYAASSSGSQGSGTVPVGTNGNIDVVDAAGYGSGATASSGQVFLPYVPAGCSNSPGQNNAGLPHILYVPLKFFYTRNAGAALPLIALQYHEVKINILWNDNQTISGDYNHVPVPASPSQAAIYVDYIYLDVEERRRMAQESHEYLIEQVQYNEDKGLSSYQNRIDLTFNHPVKELVWVVQPTCYRSCKVPIPGGPGGPSSSQAGGVRTYGTATAPATNTTSQNVNRLTPFTYDQTAVYKQWLQINGQDRLDARYGDYFNKVQPYQHHTNIPQTEYVAYKGTTSGSSNAYYTTYSGGPVQVLPQNGIYCYSFALKPEEHQPSGTCNFSRIDTATLVLQLSGDVYVNQANDATWDVRVYALNYNILRIMSGMCGLAYAN
jgi:Major capsid protein N-terminus/Large eukaryotic DNA virus major capsid protein